LRFLDPASFFLALAAAAAAAVAALAALDAAELRLVESLPDISS
jgi:hypothetical protein